MKLKRLSLILALIFLLTPLTAENFRSRTVLMPFGESTLLTKIYVFNTLDEGEKIAREVYGIAGLKKIATSGKFQYLRPLMIGREIEGYNYGIFRYGYEFWILMNVDDSKLYGMGKFIRQ